MDEAKQKNNFIKQQQQLKAMKSTVNSKVLSADSMIEDLLSKKETFQKKTESSPASFSKKQSGPAWANPNNRSLVHPLYEKIWTLVRLEPLVISSASQPQQELADTTIVSTLLMTSGLTTDMLGYIWSLANNTVPGALTQHELYCILALVALAQSGYVFNCVAVLNQVPQPPIPKLDLNVVIQLKTQFTPAPIVTVDPVMISSQMPVSSCNNIGSQSLTGKFFANKVPDIHYFTSQTPTSEISKSKSNNSIVSLDVNNLQSAPVLTIPNNFHLGLGNTSSIPSDLPSSTNLKQKSFSVASSQNSTTIESAQNYMLSQPQNVTITPSQLFQASSVDNNAIPSISLGISSPSSGGVLLNQQTNLNLDEFSINNIPSLSFNSLGSSNLVSSEKDSFSNSFTSADLKTVKNTNFGNILDLNGCKKENFMSTSNSILTNKTKICESDNLDKSFDSLSTERATASSLSGNNPAPSTQIEPNYNIDLFDSFSKVKPVFPDSSAAEMMSSETTVYESQEGSATDMTVMYNPIYQSDDFVGENTFGVKQQKVDLKINSMLPALSSNNDDFDDFTDFQSAEFTVFNSGSVSNKINNKNLRMNPSEVVSKSDHLNNESVEFSDNFSDYQQASTSISNVMPSANNSISSNEKSLKDEDFFPSFKFDSLSLSDKVCLKKSSDGFLYSLDNKINIYLDNTLNDVDNRLHMESKGNSNVIDLCLNNKEGKLPATSTLFNNSGESIIAFHNTITDVGNNKSDADKYSNKLKFDNQLTVEDKYSALRMLEISTPTINAEIDSSTNENAEGDDFGDFIAADLSSEPSQLQCELQLPDISTASPVNSIDDTSVQIKCLEVCLDILQKSYNVLISASTPEVLNQVLSDPRGSAHLTCLLEVYKVSERLMQHVDNGALVAQVQSVWNTIVPYIDGTKHQQMEETIGPICGLCKCNYGPSPVRYGLNTYHAPCANLYLHYVNPVLPSIIN